MNDYTLTIKSAERKGVLDDVTDVITAHGANISYVHLFVEKNDKGSINLELEHVEDIDSLIRDLNGIPEIKSVELHGSQLDIYGKRIIIIGGGAQVSQVAMGAITEADRHNIRGERISVDTIPLVGENSLADAVEAASFHQCRIGFVDVLAHGCCKDGLRSLLRRVGKSIVCGLFTEDIGAMYDRFFRTLAGMN